MERQTLHLLQEKCNLASRTLNEISLFLYENYGDCPEYQQAVEAKDQSVELALMIFYKKRNEKQKPGN